MPFKTLKQELYLRRREPKLWKEWVSRYGHAPGYAAAVKRSAKKAGATRKRKARKTTRKR